MIRIKYLTILILVLLSSCKTISIEEFKRTYDWEEVIVTVTGPCFGNSYCCKFMYNGIKYTITMRYLEHRPIGTKFCLLIDKKNPDKNYLFLYNKELKPGKEFIRSSAKIIDVGKLRNGLVYVKYSFRAISQNGNPFAMEKIRDIKESSVVNSDLFDEFTKLKERNISIVVDMYIINDNGATISVRPFINIEESLKQLKNE
jgi:hypothetical protein